MELVPITALYNLEINVFDAVIGPILILRPIGYYPRIILALMMIIPIGPQRDPLIITARHPVIDQQFAVPAILIIHTKINAIVFLLQALTSEYCPVLAVMSQNIIPQ